MSNFQNIFETIKNLAKQNYDLHEEGLLNLEHSIEDCATDMWNNRTETEIASDEQNNVTLADYISAWEKAIEERTENYLWFFVGHDGPISSPGKFEKYSLELYNEAFNKSYKSVSEAVLDDPEYIFTFSDVIDWNTPEV